MTVEMSCWSSFEELAAVSHDLETLWLGGNDVLLYGKGHRDIMNTNIP